MALTKINFQNLPSTTTPVNATNMNLLQTNVENWLIGSATSGVNLNNYMTSGVYYFTSNLTNAPTTYLYCLVLGNGSDSRVVQLGVGISGSDVKLYLRKCNSGTWSSWRTI